MTDSLMNEALRLRTELDRAREAPTAIDLQAEAKRMRAERDEQALRHTAVQAQGSTPDTTARALGLSRQTGLPVPVVERNLSEVERKAEFDRLGRVAEDPGMAAFVTDPTNYRLARDDFDTLQAVSDVARSLPAGAVKGLGSAAAGLGSAIDAGARQIDRGVRSLFGDSAANLFWFDGFNPATGLMRGGDFLKDVGAGVGVPQERQNLATDIAEGVGQLGQQIATLIVTGGAAGTTMLFSQGVDQQRERQDRQGVYGRDATTDAALFAGGAVTALTERYGLDFLMRKLPDPVRAGIMGKIRDVMLSAGNEAAQEVVEGILQNVVEYAFYNPDAEILQDFSREAMAAGGAAAVVRSLILAAVGGKGAARHQQAATQATQDAEALKQINTLAEQSNLRQRSPEKFAEFVRGLVEQDRSVEIDARTAAVLFQDQPDLGQFMTPDEVARLTREVALAQETGADVRMPLATFVGAFSGHAKFDELADNVRVTEGAPTAREAAEWSPEELERQVGMLRDDVASAVGQQNAAQVVFDDMFRQLKAAAVDDAAATRYAAIVAARVRTRAERLGVDPVEMYFDQKPSVRRQLQGRQDVDMLDLALDDLRGKVRISARAAYGPSLLESIADRGGVIDPGGEFKAAERWHRGAPGRKKLVRAVGPENADMLDGDGFTARYQVDSVARAMQEAGYIDENVPPEQLVEKFMELFAQEMDGRPVYSLRNRDEGRAGRLERRAMLDEQLSALGLDPNRVTAAEVREAHERWSAEQVGMPAERKRTIMDQPAWHGSPHVFDRFSLDKIGTGEGAQAFGWGLYFAGRKEIAKYYRKELAGRFGGRWDFTPANEVEEEVADNIRELFLGGVAYDTADGIRKFLGDGDAVAAFDKMLAEGRAVETKPPSGRLYKVEIPEDNEYLLWDKPLSEQPENIKAALAQYYATATGATLEMAREQIDAETERTGAMEYRAIARQFENDDAAWARLGITPNDVSGRTDQAASLALREAGIAGIKYLDGSSRAAGDGSFNYVVFDDSRVQVTEFEQREGDTPRGSIQFLPGGRSIITLTGKADLSTFLHEMSHGWLEEMKADAARADAPADIRADWERIARYLEIDPEVDEIPVEAHERFARTGEAYFMEGKAPSLELASAFERFKAWLVRIYRSIRDLNVPINDDIRGVFDRMLATDAEIAQAQEQYKFVGMFRAAKDAGMTDQEFERYQNLAAKARMEAEQKVLARLQREAARVDSDEYREAREGVANEVEAQMRAEPVYAAIRLMQDGALPDGKAAGRSYKLDRKLLKEAYGESVVKRLPRNVTAKGGVPPEMVAPMFGFTSADEMVQAMLNAAPFNAEVQARTDRIMRERFPDPTKDGTAHEEAIQALHGDAQMLVLEAEFKALKKLGAGKMVEAAVRREMAGKAAPSVGDVRGARATQSEIDKAAMAEGVDPQVRAQVSTDRLAVEATAKEAKAARRDQAKARKIAVDALRVDRKALEKASEQIVADATVGDLLNTNKWRRAEKAAADAVVDAVAARDYASAAWHQRQRIINAYLVRQSANVRAEVEKAIERFTKYAGRKAPKSIDPDYLQQVRTILDAYQFGPQLSDRKRTILELRAINNWIKALDENQQAQLEVPPEILAADEKTHYRDMKVGEFMGLRDTVESLVAVGRNKNRLLREAKERDLNRVAALVGETISQNMKERGDRDQIEKGPGYRARQFVDGFFASHRKLEFLAREMDGFVDLGPVWTALFKPLQDAQNTETRMSLEAHDAMAKMFERFPEDARRTWRTKPVYYPELGQSLTKSTVMSLALNWGNEGNREAIRKGYKWDDAQVKAVLDRTLTERDWQFVQDAWDYVDSFWPQLAGLEKRVKGVEPQKVEASPVVTPFGTLRGGYYPLKYDADRSERAYSHSVDKMAQQLMSGFVAKASTRAGAAIERVGSGGMPVRLEMDVLFEHVAELIHDISHREAVLDVNRLLDHPEVKGAVLNTAGPQFHRAMKQQVRDIAAGDVPALNWMDKTINHLRGGMSIAAMGWKLTTALVQVTGFLQSVPRVGVGPMVKHVGSFYGNPFAMKAKVDWAFSKSVELRTRANTYDRDIRDEMRKIEGNSTSAQVKRSFFYLTAMMDMGVAVPVWSAAYERGMEKFKGDETKAIDYADQMVRTTQSSGLMKDLAGIQRGGPTQKMFTMFYSYFSATYNLMVDEMKRLKRPTDMPRFVANMAFLTFLPAVLSELMMGRGPEEEDREKPEGWLAWAASMTLKYSLSGFVGVRDVVNALGTNFGYAGSPVGSAVEAVVTLGKEIGQGEADRGLAKAAFRAAGPVLHLPTGQAWITAEGIYLWAEGYDITPFEMLVTRDPNKFR